MLTFGVETVDNNKQESTPLFAPFSFVQRSTVAYCYFPSALFFYNSLSVCLFPFSDTIVVIVALSVFCRPFISTPPRFVLYCIATSTSIVLYNGAQQVFLSSPAKRGTTDNGQTAFQIRKNHVGRKSRT